MAANDFNQFHELAEQFKGEIPLKKICDQEGVNYRSYIAWRSKMGFAPRRRRASVENGLVEMVADDAPAQTGVTAKAVSIHIEFENGLRFDRSDMDVDSLVGFLTSIRPALCLG